jgi:hypothetical protein
MKHLNMLKSLLFALLLMGSSLYSGNAQAQITPCDTCTSTWGPLQQRIYYNQMVNGLMPHCKYNVYLTIQTRICNGKVEVRLIDRYVESLNSGDPACQLACFHVGYLMDKISKLLLVDLGGNIIMSKPSACYYMLEFSLTPGLKTCLGAEAGLFNNWYAPIPCDDNGCCVTEYILQPDGSVRTVSSVSTPCMSAPPSPVPSSIIIYCWSGGVRTAYSVPVVPPTTPLTCETTCHNTGDIFTAKKTSINEQYVAEAASGFVYPNPAETEITIAQNIKWSNLSILDMQGKVIATHASTQNSIDIKGLAAGNYLLMLEKENGETVQQMMTKK